LPSFTTFTARTNHEQQPERALWATVFEIAVKDLCAKDDSRERRDALAWIGSRSFDFVAHAAGLDPEAARPRLLALAARPYPERIAHARRAFGAANRTLQQKRVTCPLPDPSI
jgi:hypothetical protein